MSSPPRPSFVTELLSRPLPPLRPAKLGDAKNPPYSATLRASIAAAGVHPAVEAALHLLNDDLFSAHFLLRKMQEDVWCKWLHGILHAREGDVVNAKCWYRDTPAKVLALVYGGKDGNYMGDDDIKAEASHALDRLTLALGKDAEHVRANTEQAELVVDNAYDLDTLKKLAVREDLEEEARRHLWMEMNTVLDHLEKMHGWKEIDGTLAYTKDKQELKEQNRVLGEGWRTF
jgi:hypothetical protein